MPLNIVNLAKLTQNRASATIDFGADVGALHVEYYPQRITTRMVLDLAAGTDAGKLSPERQVQVVSAAATSLATLLASWDLTETVTAEDGSEHEQPVPLDAAHIEALDMSVAWQILNGVMAASGDAGKSAAPENTASASTSGAIS